MTSEEDEETEEPPARQSTALPNRERNIPKTAISQLSRDLEGINFRKLIPTREIDTFVGDVSLGERQIIYQLWKLVFLYIIKMYSYHIFDSLIGYI